MERGIWMDYQDFEYSILCQKKLDLHFDDHKIFLAEMMTKVFDCNESVI